MKRKAKGGIRCFKRWSRKSYGAFASLGKQVKIGVLSVSMCIVALGPRSAAAQTDTLRTARNVEMEVLSLTAEKLNPTRGVVTPAAVYDRDTLAELPLTTIESVLRLHPAIDLRERGSKGVQADISLRGGTHDQTMVMLNGINFTDSRTGHQSHSLPIDLETVNSIDIISGLSGIGAYSGAINISTAPLHPKYLRAELSGGAFGYAYGNLSGALKKGNLSVMGAASYRRSDGYTDNTDFRNINLFTRINHHSAATGLFDIQAGYQRRGFGANSFYSFVYPNQFEHTQTALGSVRWMKDIGRFTLNANISFRKNWDRFELYRSDRGAPPNWKPNYHTTDHAGAEASADYRWKGGKSTLGLDYSYHHIYSNVLGKDMPRPVQICGADGVSYTRADDRHIVNLWLGHTVRLHNTVLRGSANLAHSPYGLFPSWSLTAKQLLGKSWNIEFNSTRAMRLPTFTELYYTTNETHIGNPDLRPEKATTFQLSSGYIKKKFNAEAVVYYRIGTDVIDWIRYAPGDRWQSMQVTSLDTFGAEVNASYNFNGFLRQVSASYGYIRTGKNSAGYESKYALDYMKHKASLKVGLRLYRELTLDIIGSFYDRNGAYEASGSLIDYSPYWLLDARLSWRKRAFTLYLDATNLLNQEYFDFGGLVQAPRWITGGVIITI